MMNKAYLLIGGNEGDRFLNLKKALESIGHNIGSILQQSSLYETAPWGKNDQATFLNQALEISTKRDAASLMSEILKTERSLGRKRVEKNGPRTIDIDILLFNDEVYQETDLKIPHPELPNRRFALQPLSEIAPDLIHPVLHQSIRDLLLACTDKLDVKKI
jgi:2-amino-4-hydroxy-6-hydroxymethyldihydropteridine diphosphokinase